MTLLTVSNRDARRLWLHTHGLSRTPTGELNAENLVRELGFVQLDSIRHIERAHDHILWSRNQNYRVGGLDKLLKERALFEHFTHDASLLPMQFLPMWKRQFERISTHISEAGWWKGMPDQEGRDAIKARIAKEGALCTKDFESDGPRPKGMWQRPPHKLALDYMWYSGELATCHRKKFVKYYDLAERIFPPEFRAAKLTDSEQINQLCHMALERLGFATAGEIKRFWDACSSAEVRDWLQENSANLVQVSVEIKGRAPVVAWALADIETRLAAAPQPTARLRIINPFDPAFRDRKRTENLFGFEYRNEIFVPAAKRQYGYYVYPLLEGDRLIGRTELSANRREGNLRVANIWPEKGVVWSQARQDRFNSEVTRLARFSGLTAQIS